MKANRKGTRQRMAAHSVRRGARRTGGIEDAILKVASWQYQVFRDRFGREPSVDEPLFFDPHRDEPVAPESSQMRSLLMSAASATGSDSALVLRFFGLA